MTYQPGYDTSIRTSTRVERHTTIHLPKIDWSYFDSFEAPTSWAGSDEANAKRIWQLKEWLRICERFEDEKVYASDYGGPPRIWHLVIGVGMISAWPYWKPRPTVILNGTIGIEYADWTSLTSAEVRT